VVPELQVLPAEGGAAVPVVVGAVQAHPVVLVRPVVPVRPAFPVRPAVPVLPLRPVHPVVPVEDEALCQAARVDRVTGGTFQAGGGTQAGKEVPDPLREAEFPVV
jgi:hypothetical protein